MYIILISLAFSYASVQTIPRFVKTKKGYKKPFKGSHKELRFTLC